jgi:predicted HicB family RNase H-like nuclease
MKTRAQKILDSARAVAQTAETWADLSNALFDPVDGLVARAYPTRAAREKFMQTEEYQAIRRLLDAAEERTGLVEGATPTKSGKFMVRLPRSLHAALEAEARKEGVSLNQLVVTKLAMQLSSLVRPAS